MEQLLNTIRLEALIDRTTTPIAPDTLVIDAIALLHQSQASCVLVVENARLRGIVTPQDILRLVLEQANLSEVKIDCVMTQPVRTLKLEELQHFDSVLSLLQQQINHAPVIDERGNLVGLLETSRIFSTLRQNDNYSAELEELYHQAPCGYHSLDSEGVFIRINDTELKLLGYAREEIVGKKSFPIS